MLFVYLLFVICYLFVGRNPLFLMNVCTKNHDLGPTLTIFIQIMILYNNSWYLNRNSWFFDQKSWFLIQNHDLCWKLKDFGVQILIFDEIQWNFWRRWQRLGKRTRQLPRRGTGPRLLPEEGVGYVFSLKINLWFLRVSIS